MATDPWERAAERVAKRGKGLEFGYRHPDTGEICQPNAKQKLAHESEADVTGYGGAAGGGKSEWLSVDSAKDCLVYPRSKVALFRRTLGEIEEHLLGRFYELCGPLLDAKLVKYTRHEVSGDVLERVGAVVSLLSVPEGRVSVSEFAVTEPEY